MSIPVRADSEALPPARPLRLVPVDVLRRRAEAYRPRARRAARPWVQLALPEVSTDRTRKRRRHPVIVRIELAPPWKAQIELDFPQGVRLSRRDRLRRVGRDPNPDAPWDESPIALQRFAELFPDGMSFAEIGWVLGTRKQQAFKIYLRAMAKMLEGLGADEERIREVLRSEGTPSTWDMMLGEG